MAILLMDKESDYGDPGARLLRSESHLRRWMKANRCVYETYVHQGVQKTDARTILCGSDDGDQYRRTYAKHMIYFEA